jgi:hypothetical protein
LRSACDREEPVLGVEIGRGAEFVAVREACEHPVAAVYLDEDALYVTSPTGTVHRADLTALARTSLRP